MALFGILNVNKPVGITSRDVVNRVDRVVRPARAGHAGTLDPLASGVLVICVGQATRLIQYVQQMPKTYRALFQLGQTSETDDTEAELVPTVGAVEPTRAEVERAIRQFIGEIEQRPPAHSAVKIGGKRAYDLARRGIEVELKPRTITIYSIAVRRNAYPELALDVVCGSGTYIRSLGRDLGAALGTGAVMTALERTAIGLFRVEDAVAPEELSRDSVGQYLQPALAAVAQLPRVTVSVAQLLELRNGRPILRSWLTEVVGAADGATGVAAVDESGQLASVLHEKRPGELWPLHNFNG
jgi:tRNA pseudouridine55 synthase